MPRGKSKIRRAFTLIEILTVIAIIGVLATIIVGLNPGNPRGLDEARRIAASEFRIAQARAVLGANPDPDPSTVERYNIRAGVLVLDSPDDPDRHLRFLQTIVGGTASADKTDLSDYFWYAVGEGVLLPQGVYFVAPDSSEKARSTATILDGTSAHVTLEPGSASPGSKFGSGKKKWYAYIFDSNGQTFMSKAVFMLAEGKPGSADGDIDFGDDPFISGFVVHRSGGISFTRDDDEAKAAANAN